jgi:transcriptional regulator with XRE-family HTH domain
MDTSDFKRTLGRLIYGLRREQALSQERLALEAAVDRTWMGEIERGEADPTIDTLDKIARVLGQTLGSLMTQAQAISSGVVQHPAPRVNPRYIDRSVPMPPALTHDQLETALNRTLARLDQLHLSPADGDIQWNVYGSAVATFLARAIAETSSYVRTTQAHHPHLYHPELDPSDPDWGLEVTATHRLGKGGESVAAHHGWFLVAVYNVIEQQTHFVQVELALLTRSEWTVHERASRGQRFRSAVTIASATERLRENSVYLDPSYATQALRRVVERRRRAGLS